MAEKMTPLFWTARLGPAEEQVVHGPTVSQPIQPIPIVCLGRVLQPTNWKLFGTTSKNGSALISVQSTSGKARGNNRYAVAPFCAFHLQTRPLLLLLGY